MSTIDTRTNELLPLWAKLSREDTALRSYHPLLCHLIDVGAVARVMWESVLSPWTKRHIADAFTLDEAAAGAWVAFFAGSHDIGKACPPFQIRKATPPELYRRIDALQLPLPSNYATVNHGAISTWTLRTDLERDYGLPRDVARTVATSVGGHHGVFPGVGVVRGFGDAAHGGTRWAEARRALLRDLSIALEAPSRTAPTQLDASTAMWLAGLVSVADWIGSDERYFPHYVADVTAVPALDPLAYRAFADAAARRALAELHWSDRATLRRGLPFERLFSGITSLAPVQRAVVEMAENTPDATRGPSLVIVEAPMGEGKSEAAMYLAYRWSDALGQTGCYVALPSQATSNGMFGRVQAFLKGCYDGGAVTLQLLHGHASLSAAFQALIADGNRALAPSNIYDDASHPAPDPEVIAGEWFTYRKRGLLAPFGVGTVDQALLSILKARHLFVRLFGLSGKTVIIDEVHAYDTYMTELLEQLLRWLGALGCSVVLLSATLPRQRREHLTLAYREGAGALLAGDSGAGAPDPFVSYPRVTWASAGAGQPVVVRHVETSDRSRKYMRLVHVDGNLPPLPGAPFPLGERLRDALAEGGCAAVVCNIVGRAQAVYRALKDYFRGDADDGKPRLDLLHARYPFEDRDGREQNTLLRFGKPGGEVETGEGTKKVRRPDCVVLVATQIIEQSLDLDFDLMVTDLAPVDLVLQRSGRLWRHDRRKADGSLNRPPGIPGPTLWLCSPEVRGDGIPDFGVDSYVYDAHILLRSWLELRRRDEVRVPEQVEGLVEAVYDQRPCPEGLDARLREHWHKTWQAQEEAAEKDRSQAVNRYIGRPDDGGDDVRLDEIAGDPREEDAPHLHPALQAVTRLARPSVAVVVLYKLDGWHYLDSDGREPVDLGHEPDLAMTRRLLQRSLTISTFDLVRRLAQEEEPGGWSKSTLLRHHRPIYLDRDGRTRLGSYAIQLDKEEGLVLIKIKDSAGLTGSRQEGMS